MTYRISTITAVGNINVSIDLQKLYNFMTTKYCNSVNKDDIMNKDDNMNKDILFLEYGSKKIYQIQKELIQNIKKIYIIKKMN